MWTNDFFKYSIVAAALGVAACGGAQHGPDGVASALGWVSLANGTIHVGDNSYTGQSFDHAEAYIGSYCALVHLPRAAVGIVSLVGLRNTEEPGNRLMVDEHASPLPMMLRQDGFGGSTASAISTSMTVSLSAGPHQVCVVAGPGPRPGDLDDFEFSSLLFRADGIEPSEIEVRPASMASVSPQPSGFRRVSRSSDDFGDLGL